MAEHAPPDDVSYYFLDFAATTIQRYYKGYAVRKRIKAHVRRERWSCSHNAASVLLGASCCILRVFSSTHARARAWASC